MEQGQGWPLREAGQRMAFYMEQGQGWPLHGAGLGMAFTLRRAMACLYMGTG
jgi:hypothetical protein